MDWGINELFEGLTMTCGNHKYLLPPSSFAEAQLGLMPQQEIKTGLEETLEAVSQNQNVDAPATRHAIKRKKADLENIMERVRAHHEGRDKLLTKPPVRQEKMTGAGIWHFEIERRGDSRRQRNRDVEIELDNDGRIIHFSCPCPTHMKSLAKGNYEAIKPHQKGAMPLTNGSGFPIFVSHIACYHVAVGLTRLNQKGHYELPFTFTTSSIFEALFMDIHRRLKEATIDDYLIRCEAITDYARRQVMEGLLTLEVFKHSKRVDKHANGIIKAVKSARGKDGYSFSGFATNFRGTPYQTSSVVFSKSDGRSVHVLYDSKFGTELPFVMLNIPVFRWIEEGKPPVNSEMTSDPLASSGTYIRRFDERTQQEVVSIIARPERQLLTQYEINAYNRIIMERKSSNLTIPKR